MPSCWAQTCFKKKITHIQSHISSALCVFLNLFNLQPGVHSCLHLETRGICSSQWVKSHLHWSPAVRIERSSGSLWVSPQLLIQHHWPLNSPHLPHSNFHPPWQTNMQAVSRMSSGSRGEARGIKPTTEEDDRESKAKGVREGERREDEMGSVFTGFQWLG